MSVFRNVHVKQEMARASICFVCGGYGTEYALHSKSRENGAFFPFLEQHKPPVGADRPDGDGVVSSCFVCYSFLLQQWDEFERTNTHYSKRAYWLKRTDSGPFAGMDVNAHPDFASQYLGLPSQNNCGYASRSHTSSPVELTRPSPGIVKHEFSESNEAPDVARPRNESEVDVLDLRVSSRASTFATPGHSGVCFICGESSSKSPLLGVFSKPVANCPFFPNLAALTKPSGAKPVDAMGKVESCEKCHVHLICQWDTYQRANVPHSERYYIFRKSEVISLPGETANRSNEPVFVCFTCGYENAKSLRKEVNVHRTVQGKPCFRFLKWHMPAPGAKSISKDGKVFLCSLCYKSLLRQFTVYQMESTPPDQRVYKIPNAYTVDRSVLRDHLSSGRQNHQQNHESCLICDKVVGSLILVETLPQNSKMFFPFLRDLDRHHVADQLGRVPLCGACYNVLTAQWEAFEASQIPHSQRNYSHSVPKLASKNSALHVHVSSPEDLEHPTNHEPLLTTVTSVATQEHPKEAAQESLHRTQPNEEIRNVPRVHNPLELPMTMNPIVVAATCFICCEDSPPGFTYCISAFPSSSGNNDDWQTCSPFFPFLAKHLPTSSGEREDGNNPAVCTFCFHSLQAQWLAYETSPHVEDGNRWQRKYNTHHYVCFICGITTYRKRIRSITVKDFPFLVEHPRPPGALALQGGESVVTCLTCFESLMQQWKDYERIKLAVELRKYNWIVLPPPPENENTRNPPSHQQTWETRSEGRNSLSDGTGLPHGPKPPPMTMQAPCGGAQKPRTVTAASPLYPMGVFSASNTPAFSAARTSSFAAALRKLAKQAVDPIIDKDLSPITPVSSPALSQRSATPKHGYLNNHQVVSRVQSPPAPVHPSHHHLERRKPMELGSLQNSNSRLMEPLSLKIEPSKVQSHHLHGDKRDDHLAGSKELGGSLLQVRPTAVPMTRSEELHAPSSRGFQPYRVVEESRHQMGAPQSHVSHFEHSAPSPAYPYHPAFLQHLPHPAYRFDDPLYLEHYGMLRPPMMHLPHPSVPFYRYPREVLTQPVSFLSPGANAPSAFSQDRLKLEERQREEHHEQERREVEMMRDGEALMNHRESPSASHMSRGSESPATRMGSITHGTPRDLVVRKHSAPPSSPPAGPLNLATHPPPPCSQEVQRSRNQDVELWVARQAAIDNQHRPLSREYHHEESGNAGYKPHYVPPQPVPPDHRRFDTDLQKRLWNDRDAFTDAISAPSHGYNGVQHSIEDKQRPFQPVAERQSVINAVDARDNAAGPRDHWVPNVHAADKLASEDKAYEQHVQHNQAKKHSTFNGSDVHAAQRLHLLDGGTVVRPPQPQEPNVVSKLDIEEDKLRKARLNGSCASDENVGSDNDEDENEFKSSRFVVITKGPALKLDTNPQKMEFFSTLGLITHRKKKDIELNKFLRRRRIFKEQEKPLPVVESDESPQNNLPWHLILGSIVPVGEGAPAKSPDSISSRKLQFFESIELKPMSSETKEELERAWRVVIEDRARRHNIKLPLRELHTSNVPSQTLQAGTKRKACESSYPNGIVTAVDSRVASPPKKPLHAADQSKQLPESPLGLIPASRIPTTPFKKVPVPIEIATPTVPKLLPASHESERRVVLLSESSAKDPQSRQLAKEFAQEFHELVLQTTKQQLGTPMPPAEHSRLECGATPATSSSNLANHLVSSATTPSFQSDSTADRSAYNWPGIEAILEAYHRHQAEQKLEREVLSERCQYLQNNTRELDRDAERLSHRMSELLRLKRQQDEERQRHQSAIDNLKTYLRQIR